MNCVNCGNPLEDNDKFCTKCGQRVEAVEAAPTVSEEIVTSAPVTESEAAPAPEAVSVSESEAAPVSESEAEAAPVSESEAAPATEPIAPVPTSAPTPAPTFVSEPQKPAKKGFSAKAGILIAVTAVLVVVLALVLTNFKVVANTMKQLVMSPEKYYASIEKQGIEEFASNYAKIIETGLEEYSDISKMKINSSIDFELGTLVYEAIGSSLGLEDASGLSKIGLDFGYALTDSVWEVYLGARLDQNTLLSANALVDIANGIAYAQVPELSKDYMSVDFSDQMTEDMSLTDIMEESKEIIGMYPSAAELEEMINRYTGIVIDNLTKVTKEKDTLTVGEFEQKCTVLEVGISDADIYNMAEEICTAAKEDDVLLDFVAYFVAYAEGRDDEEAISECKAELVSSIEEALNSLSSKKASASDTVSAIMCVWLDNKGNIIGRDFKGTTTDDVYFGYKMPQKGKEFGYELELVIEELFIAADGFGSYEDNKMNGEFDVQFAAEGIDALDVFTLTIEDFDNTNWAEGKSSGTYRIRPAMELYSELGLGSAGALLAGYEVVIEFDYKSISETNMSIALVNGKELLGKISTSTLLGKAEAAELPKESIAIVKEEDVLNWTKTINFDVFRENLSKSSMPKELVTLIESYLSQFEMMLSY